MTSHQHSAPLTSSEATVPSNHIFNKLPLNGTIVGLLCLLISVYLAKADPAAFFLSFHVNWLFYVSLVFGAVFFILIQFATKAGWSILVRRLAENVAVTIPLFLVLFLVVVLGSHDILEHWLSPASMNDAVLAQKRWYLNLPFLYGRTIFYFVVFGAAAFYYACQSAMQDKSGNHAITYKLQSASYPFLIVLGFSVTFFAFDWIMSLDPHWYSTIFGLYFFASCYVSFIALLSILTRLTQNIPSLRDKVTEEHYHDLGKLVFGHSCFWAYAAFAQYLLIWYGNIPEETIWYGIRQSHGWFWIWSLLCVGHFLVPFLFLMARRAKRSRAMVVAVSIWMLVMHFADIYWLVMPTRYEHGPHFTLVDLFCFLGIGGLFIALFAAVARRKALVPVRDPRLPESLSYENV